MNLISLIIMIFLISLLVLVHELGHFIAARMFGVKVTKFGIGMPIGPTLYKTKRGDLEILIHACLFGGYVSFPEDDEQENEKNKKSDSKEVEQEKEEPKLPLDSKERFRNQEPWKQSIIVTAGVVMNVIFAFFLILLAALVFQKLPTGKSEVFVSRILEDGHVAKTMPDKILPGDKIVSINGVDVDSSFKFIFYVQNSKLFDNKVSKETINERLEEFLKLNPSIDKNKIIPQGTKIILPYKKPEKMLLVNKNVTSGLEKYKDNEIELSEDEIKLRDEIFNRRTYALTMDSSALSIATALADYYKPINIVLERNGKQIAINNIKTGREGTLGIELNVDDIYVPINGFFDAIVKSFNYMIYSTKYMIFGLVQLVTGKIPASEMHGVVLIAKIGSDIISQYGMLKGLLLTAIISIDLAIINILPIPALDGGHLMFIILEKIMGRPLNEKTVDNISKFFFTLLILLMIIVLFNDIWALFTHKF